MVRCVDYNKAIGGSVYSPHLLTAGPGPYGAVDIGTTSPVLRFAIFTTAWLLGFNHYEICDRHIHLGFVPDGHPLKNKINWGKSKRGKADKGKYR